MPHGSRRVGDVEVIALCDTVVTAGPASESFLGATEGSWSEARERHPEVFDGDSWRLHVHAFALRLGGRTILVDTGVGPESAPAFGWTATRGVLDRELDAAGIAPTDVDVVVITHAHDDHVGGNVDAGTGRPAFENARYVLHRADWDAMRAAPDDEDRAIFEATLEPLERFGALEIADAEPVELMDGVVVRHAPGHTPGHQVVTIDSGDERAIVWGDIANHPVMLLQPGVAGDTDGDPDLARRTRAEVVAAVEREGRLVASAHFHQAFGHVAADGDRHVWIGEDEPPAHG